MEMGRIDAKAALSHSPTCTCEMCRHDRTWVEDVYTLDLAEYLDGVTGTIKTQEAPESASAALAALLSTRVLLGEIRTLESFLEGALLGMMDEKSQVIDGQQVTKKRSSNKTEWDHDGLFSAVRRKALDSRNVTEHGEVEEPLDAFLRTFKSVASVSYWRVKALEEIGVEATDYRNVVWGREKIVVEPVMGDGEQSDGRESPASAAGDSSEG